VITHTCDECGCDEEYSRERRILCPWCGEGIMRPDEFPELDDEEDES
jgi:uncharacterized Zn finger protein (UPF0148 family)